MIMLRICFALILWGASVMGGSFEARAQAGYDRPGSDYTHFVVRSGDPAVCAARCERDGRCRGWAFSYPTGAPAQCWLKSKVTARVESLSSVSGVRGAGVIEPRQGKVEFSIERYGDDYRSFDLPTEPAGAACAAACEGEKNCRAWTYARPGYGSRTARCYLKERIPAPRRSPCCISGVVR
ncbi:MAG: apple protein [Xanthobacteraceae bacterium]|nr:apple protein [Xanthobacteraceae bacterium]